VKIYTGHGAPLWLSPRASGGIIIMQGQNKLLLSGEELPVFIGAINAITTAPAYKLREG
jgi:hypothetical protein